MGSVCDFIFISCATYLLKWTPPITPLIRRQLPLKDIHEPFHQNIAPIKGHLLKDTFAM